MEPIKLQYLKNSKEINAWMSDPEERRMWNIVTPGHPRFKGTFSIVSLRKLGIVPISQKLEVR